MGVSAFGQVQHETLHQQKAAELPEAFEGWMPQLRLLLAPCQVLSAGSLLSWTPSESGEHGTGLLWVEGALAKSCEEQGGARSVASLLSLPFPCGTE